jgi:hypothetical protein
MARAIERIEQDLAALEEATALLRAELNKTYFQYLQLLGQAVRRQLFWQAIKFVLMGIRKRFWVCLSISGRNCSNPSNKWERRLKNSCSHT